MIHVRSPPVPPLSSPPPPHLLPSSTLTSPPDSWTHYPDKHSNFVTAQLHDLHIAGCLTADEYEGTRANLVGKVEQLSADVAAL